MQSYDLSEDKQGIYLVKPHGKMIYDGEKTLIVKSKRYDSLLKKLIYLVEDAVSYGVIQINSITPMDADEFRKRFNEHRISELEKTRWWPSKQILFAYNFKFIKRFKKPRKVNLKPGTQVTIKEVEFLETDDDISRMGTLESLPLAVESSYELSLLFTSPGGKARVANKIISLFPKHKTYCEPFAGSAAVLFAKNPSEIEVINDIDSEIAFAYKFVKKISEKEIEELKSFNWSVSKENFDNLLKKKSSSDLERFYHFLYLATFSYGGTRNRFGYDFKKTFNFDKLMKIKERLNGVKIMNSDYKTAIKENDGEDSLFYLDPPYPREWSRVETTTRAFSEKDMKEMAELLTNLKGKFILSINSNPKCYELFHNFNIRKIKFRRTFDVEAKSEFELLISNFEPSENLSEYAPVGPSDDHEKGRPIVWKEITESWKKPMIILEDFIQLIGGVPSHEKGSTGDVDVLIRKNPPRDVKEDVPFIFRLIRALPKKIAERIHFVYDVYHGPFTSHVPIYHLALIPVEKLEVHEMTDKEELIKEHDALHEEFKTATIKRKEEIIDEHALIWRKMLSIGIEHDKISPNDELDKESRFPIEEYPPIPKKFLALKSVFTPAFLKPTSGFEKFEFADPESLWRVWKNRYSPVKPIIIEPKWDGFSFNLMKKGQEVRLITEDRRRDRAEILPQVATEVKHLPVKEVNLAAECVWFKDGKALEREEAIKVIVGKEPMEKESVIMSIHDIMWLNGKDVTALPYYLRKKLTNRIVRGEYLRNTPLKHIKPDDKTTYLKWAKKFAEVEGSEGIMAKVFDFPYETKAGETAHTPLMAKWKKSYDIEVEVKKQTPKISTTTKKPILGQYVYFIIVRGEKGEEIPIGRTFSTSIKADTGDILTIRTARLRGYKDEKENVIRFSLMWPKVLEKRTDKTKPTSFSELMKIAWFPETYELSKKLSFIAQNHFRGKSCHLDLRFERNDHLEGWTLDHLVEDAIKEPVLTVEEGRKISEDKSISKIDWDKGDTIPLPSGQPMKILTQAKATQPKNWLTAKGILPIGSPGSTKQFPGVMIPIDSGYYEEGTRKPYMYEYFIYGKHLKGIYLFRKLPTAGFKPREKEPFKEPMVWFFWKRKEQVPYMLSKRAIDTKTMPPEGISWLPKEIEEQVPAKLRYWVADLDMDIRFERLEKLRSYFKGRQLELNYCLNKISFLRCVHGQG